MDYLYIYFLSLPEKATAEISVPSEDEQREILEQCLRVIFWKTQHQTYHYISILCTIHIYLDLYVIDLGRKKIKKKCKVYLFDCQYSLSLSSSVCYLPSRTAPPSVYLDITLGLSVGVLLCLVFKWPKRQGCCFSLRALQSNTGLRLIFLINPQFWLCSVKLKMSIILALWMFPGGDSCNYDFPFFMYTKKVEAMQEGKGKENMAILHGKLLFLYLYLFVLFPLFKFKHLHSLILLNQTNKKPSQSSTHLQKSSRHENFWLAQNRRHWLCNTALRKYFYFNSFNNLSSMR